MTDTIVRPATAGEGAVYRAFWRWHFYAGLLVLPVLMLLALTGALYLFKDEIEGVAYQRMLQVHPRPAATSAQEWADAAGTVYSGRVAQVQPPARAGLSAKVVLEDARGQRRAVYVDPYDARVLGALGDGGIMQVVKRLHSLELAGPVANLLVEVVAGWAIVMVATGVVLWWPRGRSGGVVTVRGSPKKRMFWRDLHAVVGLFAGAVIVFLAVTGMPWSAFWGEGARNMITEAGLGRPKAPSSGVGAHHGSAHEAAAPLEGVPWTLQHTTVHGPASASGLTLDRAVAQADAAGLQRPYLLNIPNEPGRAWSAAYMPDRVEDTRTLYLDGATGEVIGDIGYGEFGAAAKAIEWGIAVHQGQQFGRANQLLMLAGCIAIWLLGVSAFVMWWKRRPKGRLAAPPRPHDRGAYASLAMVVVPLAILYPLVGASLLIVLAFDLILRRVADAVRPIAKVHP